MEFVGRLVKYQACIQLPKTIWYIETHLSEELTADRLAAVAEVSAYHLVRSFGTITCLLLMRYLRYRRLSKTAVELTASDLRVLEIAMDASLQL